jgi:hypothetical protein
VWHWRDRNQRHSRSPLRLRPACGQGWDASHGTLQNRQSDYFLAVNQSN